MAMWPMPDLELPYRDRNYLRDPELIPLPERGRLHPSIALQIGSSGSSGCSARSPQALVDEYSALCIRSIAK
ncbi:hypothetical protein N7528_009364 [Penicillium herquei]|nr:hypothetical protein N7528_009364 [Penicillium herquei]